MRTIKFRFLLILGLVTALTFGFGYFVMLKNNEINNILLNTPEKATDSILQASNLNDLASTIQYLDEVLTQSARNYAFTNDIVWKNRYNDNATALEAAIKGAKIIGDQDDSKLFNDIDDANLALIEMETQSMSLVDNGDNIGAQTILDSTAYRDQKLIYNNGLETFHSEKSKAADSAIATSLDNLKTINRQVVNMNITNGFLLGGLISVVMIAAMIIYLSIYLLVLKPILIIRKATTEIAKGHYNHLIKIKSRNEISDLARSFNNMASILEESVTDIENKVTSRTEELQKLNHFMTGRELKMIELKQQLKDLESRHETKK